MPIRILLVDDHEIVRAGLRMLLQAEEDMEIVGEAAGGRDAIRLAQQLHPDVVIMDITMPDLDGVEATRLIRQLQPPPAVLALTIHESEAYFFEMLRAGASGYVPKRAAPTDLIQAIRIVHQGDIFLYPSVAAALVADFLARTEGDGKRKRLDELTPREREVLQLIAEGLSNQEIAERLVISPKTVQRHRENIMAKLNLHNRIELVKYAIRKGLIDLEE
jgi:two-component system response regulator NreC